MRRLRDPLLWLVLFYGALLTLMPYSGPLFHRWFPELARPLYQQESFWQLTLAHLFLVITASLLAIVIGIGSGVLVTRRAGRAFRPLMETIVAAGQTIPPVAVLAIAVPVMAGIDSVPASSREIAIGVGMSSWQRLWQIELALAAPVIIAGIRTSVIINIGTAAIASTVGAKSLGSPVIIGLSGFNTAYVIQGALLVALLAIVSDRLFERLQRWLSVSER